MFIASAYNLATVNVVTGRKIAEFSSSVSLTYYNSPLDVDNVYANSDNRVFKIPLATLTPTEIFAASQAVTTMLLLSSNPWKLIVFSYEPQHLRHRCRVHRRFVHDQRAVVRRPVAGGHDSAACQFRVQRGGGDSLPQREHDHSDEIHRVQGARAHHLQLLQHHECVVRHHCCRPVQ